MSVEYYFLDKETKEYLFLGCGWETKDVYEKFLSIIETCVKKQKSFDYFLDMIRKKKVFLAILDEDESMDDFLDDDFIKYSLKPIFEWAYKSYTKRKGIDLLCDESLGDEAMKLLFKDKGYDYEAEKQIQKDYDKTHNIMTMKVEDYLKNKPIDMERKLFEEFEKEHCASRYDDKLKQWVKIPEHDGLNLVDYYFKSIGSVFEYNKNEAIVGVPFERALAELKSGKVVILNDKKFYFIDSKIYNKVNEDYVLVNNFTIDEVLSDNWKFE